TAAPGGPVAPPPPPVASTIAIRITAAPPSYTGQSAAEFTTPRVEALRGSRITIDYTSNASALEIAEPGKDAEILPLAGGRARQDFVLDRSRTLRVTAPDGQARLLIDLKARADAPPTVELALPAADRIVTSAPPALPLKAVATDDFGIASLSFH